MDTDAVIVSGQQELLASIAPLWLELNRHHGSLSPHFKDFYRSFTFEQRMASIARHAIKLRLFLALPEANSPPVGFGIASIDAQEVGEIDSLYIQSPHRGRGLGSRLIQAMHAWFASEKIVTRRVTVAAGNEDAYAIYEKHGYALRMHLLQSPAMP
jgi:diamine N-acetyltransferase